MQLNSFRRQYMQVSTSLGCAQLGAESVLEHMRRAKCRVRLSSAAPSNIERKLTRDDSNWRIDMSTVIGGHLYRHRQGHQQKHRGGRRRILQAANLVVSGIDVEREDASGKGVTTEDRRTRQPSESATRRIDKILHQHHASMTGERTDGASPSAGTWALATS